MNTFTIKSRHSELTKILKHIADEKDMLEQKTTVYNSYNKEIAIIYKNPGYICLEIEDKELCRDLRSNIEKSMQQDLNRITKLGTSIELITNFNEDYIEDKQIIIYFDDNIKKLTMRPNDKVNTVSEIFKKLNFVKQLEPTTDNIEIIRSTSFVKFIKDELDELIIESLTYNDKGIEISYKNELSSNVNSSAITNENKTNLSIDVKDYCLASEVYREIKNISNTADIMEYQILDTIQKRLKYIIHSSIELDIENATAKDFIAAKNINEVKFSEDMLFIDEAKAIQIADEITNIPISTAAISASTEIFKKYANIKITKDSITLKYKDAREHTKQVNTIKYLHKIFSKTDIIFVEMQNKAKEKIKVTILNGIKNIKAEKDTVNPVEIKEFVRLSRNLKDFRIDIFNKFSSLNTSIKAGKILL